MMKKCTFCADRVRQGMAPACVGTCLTGALRFGGIDKIKALAADAKNMGYPVYGLEAGEATSWVYIFPEGVTMEAIKSQLLQKGSLASAFMMETV